MGTPVEQLFNPLLHGPLTTESNSATVQWAGVTTITTAAATITVSNTLVNSNSLILYGVYRDGHQSSGVSRCIEVKTIASGAYFIFGTADNVAYQTNAVIHWFIMPTS